MQFDFVFTVIRRNNYQGWVVQRWVKFNPGLSENYSSNCFSQEKITVLIKFFSDFPRTKLVNPKFTGQFRLEKLETKPWVKNKNVTLG